MGAVRTRISLGFIALLCAPLSASAQIVISEIMYNPAGADAGREWVELYNAGTNDVSVVGGTVKGSWRISDGSNHTFTDPSGGVGRGSLVIPARGYVVIAKDPASFLTTFPQGAFSLIKSSISLGNTAATISIADANGVVLDHAAYTKALGAYDNGLSLQKTSTGAWVSAQPTPGSANATAAYSTSSPQAANYAPPSVSAGAVVPSPLKHDTPIPAAPSSKKKAQVREVPADATQHTAPVRRERTQAGAIATSTVLSQTAAAGAFSGGSWWLIAVTVLVVFGAGALLLSRKKKATEWDIVEDSVE